MGSISLMTDVSVFGGGSAAPALGPLHMTLRLATLGLGLPTGDRQGD
jgi:hypothetical protein